MRRDKETARWGWAILVFLLVSSILGSCLQAAGTGVFDVKSYGATGKRGDDARPAIQNAIEACAAAGGGIVRIPPGEYTSGTLHLRSHTRLEIETGATVFAAPEPRAYDCGPIPSKAALFYGEDLEDVALGGGGLVDGQAEYEWRADDYEEVFDHKTLMLTLGKSLWRSFPKGFPKREIFPHLVWLRRSKNVRITGLKLWHAPSWTIALYACERAVFERLDVRTSLKEGVWADGIDLDGCKDVSISNCSIETGDDCVALISADAWGPALVCENIAVTNCRLSSASAGVKFSEGNRAGIRHVQVRNTVFTNVNRAFVFSTTLGGEISDVLLSDLSIDCNRFDWFWAGDGQPFFFRITRLSEFNHEPPKPGEPPLGSIRNVTIRNVTARAKGSSLIHGHPESWLDGIRLENLKLVVSTDPAAPYDRATNALDLRWAKNVRLKDVEVCWEKPALEAWQSALYFEGIDGLELDGFTGGAAWPDRDVPAVVFNQVSDAMLCHARAPEGTKVFLGVMGQGSRGILLQENDLSKAKVPWRIGRGIRPGVLQVVQEGRPR